MWGEVPIAWGSLSPGQQVALARAFESFIWKKARKDALAERLRVLAMSGSEVDQATLDADEQRWYAAVMRGMALVHHWTEPHRNEVASLVRCPIILIIPLYRQWLDWRTYVGGVRHRIARSAPRPGRRQARTCSTRPR